MSCQTALSVFNCAIFASWDHHPDEEAQWAKQIGHSYTTQVVELAKQAGVKRLVLVHIDPLRPDDDPIGLASAQAIFANTEVAEDGMSIEF